jgi:cytochrome c2
MKRNVIVPLLALLLLVLGACGGPQVPEELLPTRIPELTMDTFYPSEVDAGSETAETEDAVSADAEGVAVTGEAVPADEESAAAEAVTEPGDADAAEAAPAEESAAPEEPAAEGDAAPAAEDPAAAEAAPAEEASAAGDAVPAEEAAPVDEIATEAEPAPDAAVSEEPAASADATTESLVPEAVTAALAVADPARGQQLTLQNACIGCHNLDPNVQMAGPTWANIANTAATRVEGESAEEYLYLSIVHPNDYLVEGYMAGVMLQNYGDTLSDQDIADIMAYLLTLQGE